MGGPHYAMAETGERIESCYRFSVRCDRAMNTRIAAAAKKAGMTANAFVQRHFNTILDAAPSDMPQRPDLKHFDAIDFARRHKVSVLAARMWRWLASRANADGRVQASGREMAADLLSNNGAVTVTRDALVSAGLIALAEPGHGRVAPVYRVTWEAM